MLTPDEKLEYFNLLQAREIRRARESFWVFCTCVAPDFYTESKPHLRILCDTLQALYERKLIKKDGKPYRNLIIEMPPRHGKTRTMTNFSAWILGKNNTEKIIAAAYGDDLAEDFSRNTRDTISQEKDSSGDICYPDIFEAKIKRGNSSFKKWALEGQFFNYKGTGISGTSTGRGCSMLLIDDPVKDAETACNETALDKIWLWYTGTLLSRAEEGAMQIISMTPWSRRDPGARVRDIEPDEWYVLSMPACTNGVMLCPEIMSFETYQKRRIVGDKRIFSANYDLVRLDVQGQLYTNLKEYEPWELPDVIEGYVAYTDTADEGKDFLASIHAVQSGMNLYVTDVLYTQDPQEITEPALCGIIQNAGTKNITIESNNGGRAFARNIERILRERNVYCAVDWFYQGANKQARILTNASIVMEYVYFPKGWNIKWPEFFAAMMTYQRTGKNKNDDAPDAVTGLVEKFASNRTAFDDDTIAALAARRRR